MYLDLGQKSFGKSKECATCGMLYVVGDEDDEQRHRQNCTKIRDGPVLPSMKGLKTVVEAEDARGNKGVIVEVRQVAGKGFPDNVAHVLGHVHKELGASDDEVRSSSTRGAGAVLRLLLFLNRICPARRFQEYSGREVAYLYVLPVTRTVVGCLIAEQAHSRDTVAITADMTSADAVVAHASGLHGRGREGSSAAAGSSSDRSSGGDTVVGDGADPQPKRARVDPATAPGKWLLGVRQVWVHAAHRRRHVARALVDAARERVLFGTVVLRADVAFAQPTDEGLRFALGYTHQPVVLAYT
jgi:N-acetyltransferase